MNFEAKVRSVALFIALVFLLIFLRLTYWQVFAGDRLSAAAEDQHFFSLSLPARRGQILFKDHFSLVSNKNTFLLYANLNLLKDDHEIVAQRLSEILINQIPLIATSSAALTPEEKEILTKKNQETLQKNLLDRLNIKSSIWINLAHYLDSETKQKILSLKISGLDFADEQTRDYPEASMAAHLIGFVGSDQNGLPKGYFGLEGAYERELSGMVGQLRVEKDAFGRPIAIGSEEKIEEKDGRNLVTTLDQGVQHFAEAELEKGIADWKASGGSVIIMEPKTGAVIAMASFPRYDPRNFSYYSTSLYKNPAIADLYEPGSIMKPLVMAAAINENKLTPETRCDQCDGPREIGGYFIHTFDNHFHPNSTMTEVLVNSDNTGMIFVGQKLGFNNLYSYFQKFGFGKKTGVDLEEEEGGGLRPINSYYPVDQATMTFGQGILVNALQMARAFCVLANGGRLPTPYLVQQIDSPNGTITVPPHQGPQIISEDTARTVTEMLVRVANESPEHFPKDRIKELDKFRIAAKSGTAQIALGGKYKSQGTTASVIGYFPAEAPKFVVYVKLNEPEVRPWGSDTAGPIYFSIIRDLIQYYGLTPCRDKIALDCHEASEIKKF